MACGYNSNQQWPTPTADDQFLALGMTGRKSLDLPDSVKLWPTPQAADGPKIGAMSAETAKKQAAAGHQEMLAGAIHTLHGHQPEMETGTNTSTRVDLNPHFVEQLMGLPKGWLTPCTLVETAWFQQWLQQHSLNYSTGTNTDA
jgi:hypothetical protein